MDGEGCGLALAGVAGGVALFGLGGVGARRERVGGGGLPGRAGAAGGERLDRGAGRRLAGVDLDGDGGGVARFAAGGAAEGRPRVAARAAVRGRRQRHRRRREVRRRLDGEGCGLALAGVAGGVALFGLGGVGARRERVGGGGLPGRAGAAGGERLDRGAGRGLAGVDLDGDGGGVARFAAGGAAEGRPRVAARAAVRGRRQRHRRRRRIGSDSRGLIVTRDARGGQSRAVNRDLVNRAGQPCRRAICSYEEGGSRGIERTGLSRGRPLRRIDVDGQRQPVVNGDDVAPRAGSYQPVRSLDLALPAPSPDADEKGPCGVCPNGVLTGPREDRCQVLPGRKGRDIYPGLERELGTRIEGRGAGNGQVIVDAVEPHG